MKCACSLCGLEKTSHARNAGWWEMRPRGAALAARWFCPACAPALLVAADAMLEGKGRTPTHRIASMDLLNRAATSLEMFDGGRKHNGEALQSREVYELHGVVKLLREIVPLPSVRRVPR